MKFLQNFKHFQWVIFCLQISYKNSLIVVHRVSTQEEVTKLTLICSKLIAEALEKDVKHV